MSSNNNNNNNGRGWVMTPEETARALQEAKARGLPDGWRVELDVRSLFSTGCLVVVLGMDWNGVTHIPSFVVFFFIFILLETQTP